MPFKKNEAPIGVFDSGIGGLTVVKHLMDLLPYENIVYFGDTARVPYGTKSEDVVKRFALEDSFFLLDHKVKLIVVACNTVSATAINVLRENLPVPVIGVMLPGAKAGAEKSRNGNIGVIGTTTTVRSQSYHRALRELNPGLKIFSEPCPLFVPMVEEGLIEDEATYLIARRYLEPLILNHIDSLILGCTHYPILKPVFEKILGSEVVLIDSGEETAKTVRDYFAENELLNGKRNKPDIRFYVSDLPYKFQEIAERFLERSIRHIETVDFDHFLVGKGKKFQSGINQILLETP